jgi:hypothetical protein
MSNIGELFKNLSKNALFENYVKELEQNKSPKEVVESALKDEILLTELRNIVDDISIIQNKMETIVNQKMKKINIVSKKSEEPILIPPIVVVEPQTKEDLFSQYISPPISVTNVICENSLFYLEQVGHTMRLVTKEYDMYY